MQPQNTNVSGNVNIEVKAEDPSGVEQVKIYVGSSKLGFDTTAPYVIPVDTAKYAGSTLNLRVISFDKLGNRTEIPLALKVAAKSSPAPTPAPTPAPAPAPTGNRDDSLVDFYEGFEKNSITTQFNCSGNCPTISSEQALSGKYAMRSEVTANMSNQKRAEVVIKGANKSMDFEKDYWFGFSVYIPSNWQTPAGFEIPFQIHEPDGNTRPTVALYTGSGTWKIKTEGAGFSKEEQFLNPVSADRGKWVDFVVQYRPSYKGTGIIKIWKDKNLVYTRTGNTAGNYVGGTYAKFGIYKGALPDNNVLYHDEIRITSNPKAGYKDVAPR